MQAWGISDFLNDLKLDYRVKDKIILLTDVNDNDLAALYRASYFTLYPSLYEGWGLPVAESLAFGKFCLASKSSSIPEVGGELLEYIDPWDVPGWADRILYYVLNPEEVQKREQSIRNEYRAHSWDESGASIHAACTALLDSADFTDAISNG
jgi:glycosyltransferase involved in cell wall biosynthesis